MMEMLIINRMKLTIIFFFSDSESFAGCTANVCIVHKNTIICANAGDSRTILCSGGKAVELS